jgi:hypothetical protein
MVRSILSNAPSGLTWHLTCPTGNPRNAVGFQVRAKVKPRGNCQVNRLCAASSGNDKDVRFGSWGACPQTASTGTAAAATTTPDEALVAVALRRIKGSITVTEPCRCSPGRRDRSVSCPIRACRLWPPPHEIAEISRRAALTKAAALTILPAKNIESAGDP